MTPAATATALRGEVAVLVVAYGQPELLERSLSSVRELRGW